MYDQYVHEDESTAHHITSQSRIEDHDHGVFYLLERPGRCIYPIYLRFHQRASYHHISENLIHAQELSQIKSNNHVMFECLNFPSPSFLHCQTLILSHVL